MTRRVVFAGGIQAKALAFAYRLDIAVDRDEDVYFIGTDALTREAAYRVISAADSLITDVTEQGPTVAERLAPPQAELIGVPVVLGDFLWPFAGRPHRANYGIPALPDGPYPPSFGDSFLDRMLSQGVPEDEAIERYLALDVAAEADLDGRLRHRLAVQDQLDVLTGFDLTDFVASAFRQQNLFATTDRLRLPLFKYVANALFTRMGAASSVVDALAEAHFVAGAMPIHPHVLRYFAMEQPKPDHRYRVLNEGMFTFEEYCRRYMRFTWNRALHEAMLLAEASPAEAIPLLRDALDLSPGSIAGQRVLEDAERRAGEQGQAVRLAAPASLRSNSPPPGDTSASPGEPADGWPPPPAVFSSRAPEQEPTEGEPVVSRSGFGNLPFPAGAATETEQAPTSLTVFAAPSRPATLAFDDEDEEPPSLPEPQPYVELPRYLNGREVEAQALNNEAPPARYVPLAPAADLIEVLPRLLSSSRGLSGLADESFAKMPETMPPPPLRPVLPPELQSEPVKRGLIARLLGRDA